MQVGSSLGRQTGCSSLWNHLRVSSRINHHVQSGRLPVLATSVLPSEEQVKKVASMFIDYGAQLIRRCFVFLLLLSWSLILCFWENDGMDGSLHCCLFFTTLFLSLEFQMFRSCYKLTAMRIAQILTET